MDRHLEAVHRRAAHEVAKFGVVEEERAALARRIRIRRLECRAARAQRAVGEELDADHSQPAPVEPRRRPGTGDGEQRLDP